MRFIQGSPLSHNCCPRHLFLTAGLSLRNRAAGALSADRTPAPRIPASRRCANDDNRGTTAQSRWDIHARNDVGKQAARTGLLRGCEAIRESCRRHHVACDAPVAKASWGVKKRRHLQPKVLRMWEAGADALQIFRKTTYARNPKSVQWIHVLP